MIIIEMNLIGLNGTFIKAVLMIVFSLLI